MDEALFADLLKYVKGGGGGAVAIIIIRYLWTRVSQHESKEKDQARQEILDLKSSITALNNSVIALNENVKLMWQFLVKIPEMEKDLARLGEKTRRLEGNSGPGI